MAERKAETEAVAKREADLFYKGTINGEAAHKISEIAGINLEKALILVEKIAEGAVPNVKVIY